MLALAVVGATVLVIAISTSSGGSNTASLRTARGQVPTAVHVAAKPSARAATPPAPAPAAKPNSATPQQNGGDGDPDNNGGPDDGDGGI